MQIAVPFDAAGLRLDVYLTRSADAADAASAIQGLSRARIQQLIDAADVRVDGQPRRPAYKLRGGEVIDVVVPQPTALGVTPVPMPLDIRFEDAHLIVLVKPAGLLVHPGAGAARPTLVHGLLSHCHDLSGIGGILRPGIVHRLDRGTSGVMVVAKHDRAHEALARAFASRQVTKEYIAYVYGQPKQPAATLETFYGRHATDRRRFTGRLHSGRKAITHYKVSIGRAALSRLDVLLGTGRTHQIRVHLAELGHGIVGDPTYGKPRHLPPELRQAVAALDHQALHAAHLAFAHPMTGELLSVKAELPADVAAIDRLLRADP